jgi:hypothetical protein
MVVLGIPRQGAGGRGLPLMLDEHPDQQPSSLHG